MTSHLPKSGQSKKLDLFLLFKKHFQKA